MHRPLPSSKLFFGFFVLAMSTAQLSAVCHAIPVTYSYAGNVFSNFGRALSGPPIFIGRRITGSFTIDLPSYTNLPFENRSASVTAFSFTEGFASITNLAPLTFGSFQFATDGTGGLTDWDISAFQGNGASVRVSTTLISTTLFSRTFTGFDIARSNPTQIADVGTSSMPGTWTNTPIVEPPDTPTTDVPEPVTLTLFGLGLAGLGFARRRKKLAA